MPDQITQLLDQIEQADALATPGPWRSHQKPEWLNSFVYVQEPLEDIALNMGTAEDAYFVALSRTALPALAQAVRAVLERHKPVDDYIHLRAKICSHRYCVDEALDQLEYPCPTVQAITEALGADDA